MWTFLSTSVPLWPCGRTLRPSSSRSSRVMAPSERSAAEPEASRWNGAPVPCRRCALRGCPAGGAARPATAMILTNCVGPMWYRVPIWEAIRGWGLTSPVVVISPLPSRLWSGTALGSPEVTMRSRRPGAANRLLDVTLPWWWPDSERPVSCTGACHHTEQAGPVATWARMAMGVGGVESTGVFATPQPTLPTSKATARSGNGPPDAVEQSCGGSG